jgi:hypothetical protein
MQGHSNYLVLTSYYKATSNAYQMMTKTTSSALVCQITKILFKKNFGISIVSSEIFGVLGIPSDTY